MAAPTLYRSSDTSAPVLTGTAGDLVNVLRKCLVDGYGSQTGAGWTMPFTDGATPPLRAVFRQGGGNQFYLDMDDRGASSILTGASGSEAAVRGYEAMTAVATGTNPFPTTAQVAAATANWRKSATTTATARGWFVLADDRTFYLGILDGDVASQYKVYAFGDLYSLKSTDGFRTFITVRTVVNSAAATGSIGGANAITTPGNGTSSGQFIARVAAGTGTSTTSGFAIVGTNWEVTLTYSGSLDGGLYLSRLLVVDPTPALRGWMRGAYEVLQAVGLNDGDTFTGTGDFAGRSFVLIRNIGLNAGQSLALETTAWDTST